MTARDKEDVATGSRIPDQILSGPFHGIQTVAHDDPVAAEEDQVLALGVHLGAVAFAGVRFQDSHAETFGAGIKSVQVLAIFPAFAADLRVHGRELGAIERRCHVDARAFGAVEQACNEKERNDVTVKELKEKKKQSFNLF